MSCRVAGKYLEPAMVTCLMHKYNANIVHFVGINNQKNKLLIDTLLRLSFCNCSISDDVIDLSISSKDLLDKDIVLVSYY